MADMSTAIPQDGSSMGTILPQHHTTKPQTSSRNEQLHDSRRQSAASIIASHMPSRRIPPSLTAYSTSPFLSPAMSRMICLTDDSQEQPIFAAEQHTGYSGSTPLGTRPGVILYDGTTKNDPVIAAAGYESQWAARPYSFSVTSVILLPPIGPEKGSARFMTEKMRARSHNKHGVIFQLSLNVESNGKFTREKFEWRKVKKSEGGEANHGGFDLLWLSSSPHGGETSSTNPNDMGNLNGELQDDENEEVVASLVWLKKYSSAFSLAFKGHGLSDTFGERWKVAVIMTALRLWILRVMGGTSKPMVAIGQTIRG